MIQKAVLAKAALAAIGSVVVAGTVQFTSLGDLLLRIIMSFFGGG